MKTWLPDNSGSSGKQGKNGKWYQRVKGEIEPQVAPDVSRCYLEGINGSESGRASNYKCSRQQ